MGGAGRGQHGFEAPEAHVRVHTQRMSQTERADTPHRMARPVHHFVGVEHAGLGLETGLESGVVDAGIAPQDQQNHLILEPEREGFGDLPGHHAMCLGGFGHRGRAGG
ncbi:hypothetical protein RZS08_41655, partial [Arthrospira platensis SPKY1]|nr:hypothetical protein [Arthrospira platensis SPKY1]